jgi:hypothetical protein
MKLKKFFIAHNSPIDREFLLGLLSAGLTSVLLRPASASWQLAGHTLVQPQLRGAIGGRRDR